jgi:hypothetical protein
MDVERRRVDLERPRDQDPRPRLDAPPVRDEQVDERQLDDPEVDGIHGLRPRDVVGRAFAARDSLAVAHDGRPQTLGRG